MLIRFRSPAHHDVLMFGNVARQLLSMMGMSGQLPSAANPEDLPAIKARLLAALDQLPQTAPRRDQDESDDNRDTDDVPLRVRAMPLIDLIDAAIRRDKHVMWEEAS